jgi:hypothetical protein
VFIFVIAVFVSAQAPGARARVCASAPPARLAFLLAGLFPVCAPWPLSHFLASQASVTDVMRPLVDFNFSDYMWIFLYMVVSPTLESSDQKAQVFLLLIMLLW